MAFFLIQRYSISEVDIRMLESVDEHLLRSLVKGHAKTPLEFLCLEAGAVPLRFLISSRMTYLQHILKRKDSELIKRIYKEKKVNPTPGHFSVLVKKDFEMINDHMDEAEIERTSVNALKKMVKSKVKIAAFKHLQNEQSKDTKVKDIKYNKIETQKYLLSPLFFNYEVNLHHSLRSRSIDLLI